MASGIAVLWLLLAPTAVGGQFGLVTTEGTSMKPRFTTGDLAVVHRNDHYAVGQVVAYNSQLLNRVVMHRIVDADGDRLIFKGDNNNYLDPDRPTTRQCIGALVLRVPQGGMWLHRVTSPAVLTVVALALLTGGASATRARRTRRSQRMSRHAAAQSPNPLSRSLDNLPAAWAITAALSVLAALLTVVSWTTPTTSLRTVVDRAHATMAFSYSAKVPPSAAYDDTVVSQPQPIFRKLVKHVVVRFDYRGVPGHISVQASVRADSGWQTTVPLAPEASFDSDRYKGSVALDLDALQARAAAAAALIGVPADQLTIGVTPTVRTLDGNRFSPTLAFVMTATRLTLAGDSSALTVRDTTPRHLSTPAAQQLRLGALRLGIAHARLVGPGLLALTLLAGAGLTFLARRSSATGEATQIRRRYGRLLVRIQPMPAPASRPIVDVTDFPTLVKLADRYGLLILHWARSDNETFVVQDEGTTYRYRVALAPDATLEKDVASADLATAKPDRKLK